MIISPTDQVCFWEWEIFIRRKITANHQLTFLFKPANPLPLIRKSLWCNEQMRRSPLLNHVLFLQTQKKQIDVRTDWTDRFGRSESASYSLRQWPGSQQGLLHVKIFGVKDQRYQQNAKEEAHFLSIVLEQLTRLESWFSHVHPELLLSLQQLIHFVLPAIESFQKRSHPGNAYAMTNDLWEDHCGAYSILAKNLGWRVDVSTSTSDVAP